MTMTLIITMMMMMIKDRSLTNVWRQKFDSRQLSEPDGNVTRCLMGLVRQRCVGAVRQQEQYDLQVTLASRFITRTHARTAMSLDSTTAKWQIITTDGCGEKYAISKRLLPHAIVAL